MLQSDHTRSAFNYVLDEDSRILVVDDDPIQREFAGVYLATPNAHVDVAVSGSEALQKLAAGPYDIVLVDFDMPDMTGLELIEILRKDARFTETLIVMVTSHEDIVTIDAAYRAGATSFVTKPVNWRLLSYHLKFVLKNSRKVV